MAETPLKSKLQQEIFELNNQRLVGLPMEKNNLFKALNMALRFNCGNIQTTAEEIRNFLKALVMEEKLPRNLAFLQTSTFLLQDYLRNPFISKYDKVNLELFSLKFERKIIVYSISEDFCLNTRIFNTKFSHTLEIFYDQGCYDTVFPLSTFEIRDCCIEVIDKILETRIPYSYMAYNFNPLEHTSRHKRSFSEMCLYNDEESNNPMNQSQGLYNPFKGMNPPNDFLKKLTKDAKKTPNISNFSSFDKNSCDSFMNNEIVLAKDPLNGSSSFNKMPKTPKAKKHTGYLKFFDEAKNYGFFVMDEDKSDIFVHYDDLAKAKITKETLKEIKGSKLMVKFAFNSMTYIGKYNRSRKAIDIEMINLCSSLEI